MRRLAVLVVLVGCGLPEDRAPETMAAAVCAKARRCDRGEFDTTYDSIAACEEALTGIFNDIAAWNELLGCEYDPGGGRAVLHDVRSASCAEWEEGDAVDDEQMFDCSGG